MITCYILIDESVTIEETPGIQPVTTALVTIKETSGIQPVTSEYCLVTIGEIPGIQPVPTDIYIYSGTPIYLE